MSYIARILCIRIHICKRYYFPLLLFPRRKTKEKQFLDFGLDLSHDLINVTVAFFERQAPDMFYKKRALENLANFTGNNTVGVSC